MKDGKQKGIACSVSNSLVFYVWGPVRGDEGQAEDFAFWGVASSYKRNPCKKQGV